MNMIAEALRLHERLSGLLDGVIGVAKVLLVYIVVRAIVHRAVIAVLARASRDEMADHRTARLRTLATMVQTTIDYIITGVMLLLVLREIGIDIAPILATAGVAGLAVGFGAQRLVRDVISGFFILAEDQFNVGELVTIGAVTGVVETLGMRVTRLRDLDGRVAILANGDIVSVINHSRRGGLRASVTVRIRSDADQTAIETQLKHLAQEAGLLEPSCAISALDATAASWEISGVTPPTERIRCENRLRAAILATYRDSAESLPLA